MDGVHDLGGIQGFGPVHVEEDEPVFHADWERRAFRMTIASMMAGHLSGAPDPRAAARRPGIR